MQISELKVSPSCDGTEEMSKINNEKSMGESDDENMSGFDSDSEDESNNNGNCKKVIKLTKFVLSIKAFD